MFCFVVLCCAKPNRYGKLMECITDGINLSNGTAIIELTNNPKLRTTYKLRRIHWNKAAIAWNPLCYKAVFHHRTGIFGLRSMQLYMIRGSSNSSSLFGVNQLKETHCSWKHKHKRTRIHSSINLITKDNSFFVPDLLNYHASFHSFHAGANFRFTILFFALLVHSFFSSPRVAYCLFYVSLVSISSEKSSR